MKVRTFSALILTGLLAAAAQGQRGNVPPPPANAQAGALIDLTGYWVSIVDEDWRWRMVTAPKGDYAGVPLNPNGIRQANTWDLAADQASGQICKNFGAAAVMRLPTRLHITWADPNTLKIETDAGTQTRLVHFDPPPQRPAPAGASGAPPAGAAPVMAPPPAMASRPMPGPPSLQGDSTGAWEKQIQFRGFAGRFGGPVPGKGGDLKVTTTNMTPGYLRRNGAPYSGNAQLIEFFNRIEPEGAQGDAYVILTSIVNDPQYLNDTFITSEQFKREPDAAKWDPSPCSVMK